MVPIDFYANIWYNLGVRRKSVQPKERNIFIKKILSLLVAVTLLFCFSPSVLAANAESENTPVSDLLLPYVEVIEEVNEETGSQIYIPAGKEEDV